jgi:predicted transcriptional regulator
MNYIEQIRGFWRSHEEHSFTPTEVAVYFRLLEICNICQWKNPFKRNNSKIEADLGISFNTLKNARNKLRQAGLIDFETRNGSPNVSYTLLNFDKVSNEVDVEVDVEVLPTKDKLNKTLVISPVSPKLFPAEKPKKKEQEKKVFVPPDEKTINDYFKYSELRDWEIQASKFFNHYNSQGWKKGTGVAVVNWDSLANNWILTEKQKNDGKDKRGTGPDGKQKPKYGRK